MVQSARRPATLEDFLAIPAEKRFHELVSGEIIERAAPSGAHGNAQAGVVGALHGPFQRKPGSGGPGGWWISTEVEVLLLDNQVVRPDVLGWRRERCPERPTGIPVKARPDWVCEVVSAGNARDDTVRKLRLYQQAEAPHYWLVEPSEATVTVLRWSSAGYVSVLVAERGERVRAEPFEAVELDVGTLFGDEPLEA
jgi:Uma2 family endonuclease